MGETQRGTERRTRLLDAALEIIAEQGVPKTTHRLIAERAGVPLGSATYYFDGLDAILEQAFARLSETMADRYRAALEAAADRNAACEVVTDLICGPAYASPAEMTALFEMYSYANHNAVIRATAGRWLEISRASLSMHFSDDASRALDALIEGWPMHRVFEGRPLDRRVVLGAVTAIVDRFDTPADPTA